MEHLLKLSSLTPDEIIHILDVADEYKRLHKAGTDPKDLQGKAVALMFGKHSTRTRTSLEVGIYQMGGLGTYLSAADMQVSDFFNISIHQMPAQMLIHKCFNC